MDIGNKYVHVHRRTLLILSHSGPRTAVQLALEFPACLRTIQRALTALHSQNAVFISDYKVNRRGRPSKIWSAGTGVDVKPPRPRTSAERLVAMRRGWSPEERDFARARRRALARKPRRDKLIAAFFGPSPKARPLSTNGENYV
jgi:predicted ArsR family transcriptional regulator